MKHRGLTGLVASSLGGLLLGFACVDADIPNVSNNLRDALEETYGNAGAPPVGAAGNGGSASTPSAGAGGAADDDDDEPAPDPDDNGGAAGSSMAGTAGSGGESAGGGAGGGGEPSGDVCNGFALLQRSCGLSGCHAPEDAPFSGFAASEESARSFIGVEGTTACNGQGPLIDPENPEDSIVVGKASGDPPCGGPMPPVGEPLTEEELDCVVEWIGSLAE